MLQVLPWIAGTLWMIWLESVLAPSRPVNWPKMLGYGFFVGAIMLVCFLRLAYFLPDRSPGNTTLILFSGMLFLSVALLWRRYQAGYIQISAKNYSAQIKAYWLIGLLVMAIGLHLGFAALDVFSRPVFPWDAWGTWVYRTKIWYFSGELTSMQNAADWLKAGGQSGYTMQVYDYPAAVSLIYLWPALVNGAWSDVQAVVPAFFAGIAISLGLYGQVRQIGGSVVGALLLVYLFFSLPLIDAHLALAGYADIWMAGFAGLGFVSLLGWASDRTRKSELLLGLFFLLAAVFIKREGVIWLAGGLVFILLQITPWKWLLLGLATVMLAWVGGIQVFELPGIGKLGIEDGVLYLPYMGEFPLQYRDTGMVVLHNLFSAATWNLLPVYLLLALFLTVFAWNAQKRIFLSFLLPVATMLIVIFGFSNEARWVADSTAFNRLVMQLSPALLFALFIQWQSGHEESDE